MPEPGRSFGAVSIIAGALGLVVVLACVAVAGLFVFGLPGIGSERLRFEAEAAISRLAGFDVSAAMGDPRLSVDASRFLGLEVDDVRITGARQGASLLEAGSLRFGVRFLPLLSGRLQLGSAGIENARISLAAFPRGQDSGWARKSLVGPDGLVDPKLVMEATFAAVARAFDGLDAGSTRLIDLADVEIVLPADWPGGSLHIAKGRIAREASGKIAFEASASLASRTFGVTGSADRGPGRSLAFVAQLNIDPLEFERDLSQLRDGVQFATRRFGGSATVSVTGRQIEDGASELGLAATLDGARLEFSGGEVLSGSGRLSASFRPEERKVEIDSAELVVGRSRFSAHGAVGPAPAADGEGAHYRYELVSDGSLLAPGGAAEPDLPILARFAGGYDPARQRLTANEIALRTSSGTVEGTAIVSFVEGGSPGLELALSVPEMSVSHVKQIWPWFAAYGAHNWASEKLFGGTVRDSRLVLSARPGRFGSGVPLSRDEISGYFAVSGARFDVTGQIPPVRDGVGTISFQGTDADIRLVSGTVYLPTGRTVAASNGTFVIRRGDVPPVIGALNIDIAGSADAVAELASYKPIDAMRHLALAPEEFSGSVTGNIEARIPLQAAVNMADLGWAVKLAYTGLSIAKPFEGQSVTDASGTIDVVPTVAFIKADARLNGIEAKLDLAEPLGGSGVARRRDISLVLDSKARSAMAPGLESILAGPVSVKMSGEGARRTITADLVDATLSVPWVGWSKGPGIPAKLAFGYETVDGETRVSNLKLSGQSFSLSGAATLTKLGLSQARFDKVSLNRGDDVAVDIRRSGEGYAISARGASFDARALIKQALDTGRGGEGDAKAVPIVLDAEIGSVSGFQGEALANVKIAYRGSGSRIAGLKASGTTASGDAFSVSDATQSGQRTVSMASANAGAVLRFFDIYPYMDGGRIKLDLASNGNSPLRGQIDARDFALVDEPRLRSIVSSRPAGDTRSLNEAVRGDLDTSRVGFERGFARIEKGKGYLSIENGVLRGPAIGTTFQGSLYDAKGNMSITGTFMPAYGLNRLFGEIPLLGQLLGNGRDRGLIGITYKVAGDAKSPQLQVNPISAIAPGIFRSIFEFN